MQPTDPYVGTTPEDIAQAVERDRDRYRQARDERMEKYARHSRNANVFVAVVVALWVLLSTIGGIWVIVQIANASSSTSTTISSPTCISQGGYDTSC